MTNLYETLGCTQESSKDEILAAYNHLASFYKKEAGGEMDQAMKIFFDDLTLAFTTIYNEDSRQEYDEYLT